MRAHAFGYGEHLLLRLLGGDPMRPGTTAWQQLGALRLGGLNAGENGLMPEPNDRLHRRNCFPTSEEHVIA
jgi:hypothetical protein